MLNRKSIAQTLIVGFCLLNPVSANAQTSSSAVNNLLRQTDQLIQRANQLEPQLRQSAVAYNNYLNYLNQACNRGYRRACGELRCRINEINQRRNVNLGLAKLGHQYIYTGSGHCGPTQYRY